MYDKVSHILNDLHVRPRQARSKDKDAYNKVIARHRDDNKEATFESIAKQRKLQKQDREAAYKKSYL
jgi:hypothetical protein